MFHDHRLGIHTRAMVATRGGEDSIDYMPIPYRHLTRMLRKVDMDEDCVFLDYGSGMGRVVTVAATYPIRRAIGVELSHEMVAVARSNLAKARGIICREVEFVEENAANFVVPDDVSVIHFYNPFVGETLAKVVHRIRDTMQRRARTIQIIFFNHGHFDHLVRDMDWVRQIFSERFYPHYGGALYETVPSSSPR
jgi:cyclopropane fatty-acyl-phospholipid synthase-like methyltransferase